MNDVTERRGPHDEDRAQAGAPRGQTSGETP
jgi:hypothetical protein